jgi:hypothetical protein
MVASLGWSCSLVVVKCGCMEDGATTYDEHVVVPVILCAAVGHTDGSSLQE